MKKELEKILKVRDTLTSHFVERDKEINGLILAILSQKHVLFLGAPGTAKSLTISSLAKLISGANYFQWLLTKYTTPEELFGPFSLAQLENDKYVRITTNKAPEAHFVFFDEIWKANSGILNANLTLVNERLFYNGPQPTKVPLLTLIGASNELPEEDDNLEAMLDRFILKFYVKPIVEEENFMQMLSSDIPDFSPIISLEEIKTLQDATLKVTLSKEILEQYASLKRDFNKAGLISSDRTYRATIDILKAQAILNGRTHVVEDDFEVLRHCLWSDPKNESPVYNIILREINPDKNKVVELYESAHEVFDKLMGEKDTTKRMKEGVEVAVKLREYKKKVHEYMKSMQKKNKDVREIEAMEKKIDKWLQTVFVEGTGITF